jgi:hypothetical protein
MSNSTNTTETLEELRLQQKEIERKINRQMTVERNKKITAIIADMANYNISLGDIEATIESKQKASIVRYINPETGATWSGAGKRPKWIIEALNAGKDLTEFEAK